MSAQGDEFQARMKKVRSRIRNREPVRVAGQAAAAPEAYSRLRLMRFQLAFLLGMAALIAGRGFAMNYLGAGVDTATLGRTDGAAVMVLLLGIGLMFGRSDFISHVLLLVGAWVAFIAEAFYIAALPDLMSRVYTPTYVGLVNLGG